MNKTVIIAESSPAIAREIAQAFTEEGFHVLGVFHDGMSALRCARENSPGVVSLDLILPKLSGLQLALQLGQMAVAPTILAISAVRSHERLAQAKNAGVNCYILKPMADLKLRAVIRAQAERYQMAVAVGQER